MLLYVYFFKSPIMETEVAFYAPTEQEARQKYYRAYGVEPGTLIRRENW